MIPITVGLHLRSETQGFGYVKEQHHDLYLVHWDNGEFSSLSRDEVSGLELFGVLPISALPITHVCVVYRIDFKAKKLIKTETHLE